VVSESVVAAPGAPPPPADREGRGQVVSSPSPTTARTGAQVRPRSGLPFAVAAGACLALAFPGTGWWPLAPVGVGLLTLAARGVSARRGAVLGLVTGLTFFLPHLHWSGIYVGALPWFALATLEASFVAVLGALLPLAWRAPGGRAGTVLAVAGLWVGQEALRGRVPFGGFPWGRLAFSQADSPALGWAAVGGAPLLGAVVAAAGGALAVAVVAVLDRGATLPRRAPVVAATLGAALLLPLLGLAVPTPADAPRSAQVAAVQGNVPRAGLEFNAERRAVLDNHAAATIGFAARVGSGRAPQPDVVVWPENASDIDPLRNRDAAAVIQRATDAVGVPVLVGAVLAEPADRLSNAGILWGPTGSTNAGAGARYLKQHPAPFGEYIPARSFFRLLSDKVDLVRRDFVAGSAAGVLDAGAARLGDVICFEVAYDGLVRESVRQGADLLVVQTNNATFGLTDESVQQLAMSRVRAVENGRAVVHISTVGVSALIAPDGSVVERSGHFTQEVLQARLPLRTDSTLATRAGAWPEALVALLGLGLVGAAGLRGRRADRAAATPPAVAAR
jgi:apolipoprotein N-acyltransferase